jgi:rhamnosyl/mannosyltransferase
MAKILQLSKYYPPYSGGIELVAKMVSKAHAQSGDQVTILSFGNENINYKGEFGERVFQNKNNLVLASTPLSLSLLFSFYKRVKKEAPDLIYVHLPNPLMHLLISVFYRFLKRSLPNLRIHGIYHSDIINQKRLAPIYNFYFIATSRCYDKFIVACSKIWDHSPVLTKISLKKQKIVHYCSDLTLPYVERKKFKGNLVAIGRCVPYKGFDFLIKTINNTAYNLTIIGNGPEYETLKSLANDNIKLPGRVSEEEKEQIINSSDLLIVSSINNSEAYGMISVEAFSNGLPVIAANVPSCVTFLAENGKRALNFEPLDAEGLLQCLQRFENEPELINQFSKNAYNFHQSHLSFEAFSKRLLNDL